MKEVKIKIEQAIQNFLKNENQLLTRNLNEVLMSTSLAKYVAEEFEGYDTDSEYNGDIDKPNDRKALEIAANRINEVKKKVNDKNTYKIYPDIIVHERGSNDNNHLVFEIKKDIHSENKKEYDLIKLEHLTINYMGNHYNYDLGIQIIFGTSGNTGTYEINYVSEGILHK